MLWIRFNNLLRIRGSDPAFSICPSRCGSPVWAKKRKNIVTQRPQTKTFLGLTCWNGTVLKIGICDKVMSKTKGQTFPYRFGTKSKRFGIVPDFVLLKTDCFDLVQKSALLEQIEMISFDKTNSPTTSVVDTYHWLADPAPDPAFFVSEWQDANKKSVLFSKFFCFLLFEGTFTSVFKDKKSNRS